MNTPITLTRDEEAQVTRTLRRMAVHRETNRRDRESRGLDLRVDRLQQLEDFVQAVNDLVARVSVPGCVGGDCVDVVGELRDLLVVHDLSSRVAESTPRNVDSSNATVEDAADTFTASRGASVATPLSVTSVTGDGDSSASGGAA